ncbi:MAG: acyl-CoA desaturase [Kofleriaceae bacterium]
MRWRDDLPFWGVHVVAVVGAVVVGWSGGAAAWLVGGYAVRMFAITAGYHRYFSHRTYKTSRTFQFLLALVGMSAAQQGPLWWAAHHRNHHRFSDQPEDVHSPRQRGFWWAHVRWILAARGHGTDLTRVRDLARYPELRFLDRHDLAFAVGWGVLIYLIGGWTAVMWGHFVAIVLAWHITFCINSLAHVLGSRRYATSDDSRNNPVLAVLTLGEGWHNNHHHYQRSARQGFFWWELDVSYYVLKLLELARIVRDVEGVPAHVRDDKVAPARLVTLHARSQASLASSDRPALD